MSRLIAPVATVPVTLHTDTLGRFHQCENKWEPSDGVTFLAAPLQVCAGCRPKCIVQS